MAQKPATLSLCERLDARVVLKIAGEMPGSSLYRHPRFLKGPATPLESSWDSLFAHHDPRSLGWGYFCPDAAERRSRRLDMRGPTDVDPGPLAMNDAEEGEPAVVLHFENPA
jgi:hypothetical protein